MVLSLCQDFLLLEILLSVLFALRARADLDVQNYLQKFGYLPKSSPESGNFLDHDHFTSAVRDFQAFANLPVTGKSQRLQDEGSKSSMAGAVKSFQMFAGLPETGLLDDETKRLMDSPRCGVPDVVDGEEPPPSGQTHRRRKRFVLQGSKWKVRDLTWSVSQMTTQLNRNDVESQIAKAWKIWSDKSGLTFTKADGGNVHIDIKFAKFDHGDGDPFDGPGKTLAHAFFPQYGGDAHFDDSETWSTGRWGTNLFQVAAHEFGHSLGLSHSNVRASLMAPFYRGYDDNLQLDVDDVEAIQEIYGPPIIGRNRITDPDPKPTIRPPPRRPNVIPGQSFDICGSPVIDAITITADGNTYAFRGDLYYQLTDSGIESGYPRKIREDWSGLPNDLDAALTWSDGKTFFFKGDKYWRFDSKKPLKGYPKLISKGFTGIPSSIDAAFTWSGNGKTYFIKGTQYWRYDSALDVPVSSDYPKSLSTWSGLPPHIDAAFQWKNGKTFFFSGPEYYRFNDHKFEVEIDYPRPNAVWWFGCSADSKKDFVSSSGNTVHDQPRKDPFWFFKQRTPNRPRDRFDDFPIPRTRLRSGIEDSLEELNDVARHPSENIVSVSVESKPGEAHFQYAENSSHNGLSRSTIRHEILFFAVFLNLCFALRLHFF